MKPRLLVIAGPTASGKSELALRLAQQLDAEIVCADSLTIYRGIDIGSAKPTTLQRSLVPHHLLDIRNPSEAFTVADFISEATTAIHQILKRGKRPIVAGGTGLYLRALLGGLADAPGENPEIRMQLRMRGEREGGLQMLEELRQIDPITAESCHQNNLLRIIRGLEVWHSTGKPLSSFHAGHGFQDSHYDHLFICLQMQRDELYKRIEKRVDLMLEQGLVAEVKALLDSGLPEDAKPLMAIGYKEVTAYLKGRLDLTAMSTLIKQNTRNLAKRQITWFKKESALQLVAYPENSVTIETVASTFFKEGEKPHVKNSLQHSGPIPEPGPQGKGQGNSQDDVR